jgi:hypothetical protein
VSERNDLSLLAAFKADSLAVYFDMQGLKDKVIEHPKNKKGVVDEAIWTKVLDTEIRSGIISAAYSRYGHESNFYRIGDPLISIFLYESIYNFISTGDSAASASIVLGLKTFQLSLQARRATRYGSGFKDANWTTQIYTSARTDRLIATALSSKLGGKTLKLVG